MRIIGHRGASGLALENTLPSLELARLLGVDAIEIDVRKTKDNQLVVFHDSDLSRLADNDTKISDLTFAELKKVMLSDGQSHIPTLEEALQMSGDIPVIIELKTKDCTSEILETIDKFPSSDITIASFKLNELIGFQEARPDIKLVGLERTKPFDIINFARSRNLQGVGMNFWLLNPLTYFLVKRNKLSLYVYTVNNRLLGNIISVLYPGAAICTNHPEWFIKHPWLRIRKSPLARNLHPIKRRSK